MILILTVEFLKILNLWYLIVSNRFFLGYSKINLELKRAIAEKLWL